MQPPLFVFETECKRSIDGVIYTNWNRHRAIFFLLSLQFGITTTAASSVKWKKINLERNSELCSQSGKRLLAQSLPCHQWKVVLFYSSVFWFALFFFRQEKKEEIGKKNLSVAQGIFRRGETSRRLRSHLPLQAGGGGCEVTAGRYMCRVLGARLDWLCQPSWCRGLKETQLLSASHICRGDSQEDGRWQRWKQRRSNCSEASGGSTTWNVPYTAIAGPLGVLRWVKSPSTQNKNQHLFDLVELPSALNASLTSLVMEPLSHPR